MTIHEAITQLDILKHNTFTDADKIAWLSQLDGRIRADVMDTHEGGPEEPFTGYDPMTPRDTALLVPFPDDGLYVAYLQVMVDYHNGEIEKYNNSSTVYRSYYNQFRCRYTRTHMPKGQQWKFQ